MTTHRTSPPRAVAGSIAKTANPNTLPNGSRRHAGIEYGKRRHGPCRRRPAVPHQAPHSGSFLFLLMLLLWTLPAAVHS